jgi:uncharacterized protein (DUF433 family)
MATDIKTVSPPLRIDSDGAIRIGGSQVLLETVVRAFRDGATAETIVQRFPTVGLADAYATIAYALSHGPAVDQYLAMRDARADEVRRKVEARQGDLIDIRRRLLSQRPG